MKNLGWSVTGNKASVVIVFFVWFFFSLLVSLHEHNVDVLKSS